MGIYDRDYARATNSRWGTGGPAGAGRSRGGMRPGRLGPPLRGLSFIHWLIIINVAVFMIDALCGARGVLVAVHQGDRLLAGVDPSRERLIMPAPPSPLPRGAAVLQGAILRASNQEVVGVREWRTMPPLSAWGHFSTAKAFFGLEVWRFVTFQFLHASMTHLLLNMMGLWFFGPLVEEALRTRNRMGAYYLVCGICGALLYLSLNLAGAVLGLKLPGVLFSEIFTPLVGASAGVFGVLMAAAKIAGDGTMLIFMIIPMRIRTGAYLMTALALFNLLAAGNNAGGDAAHVGGAVAGFFFIRNMHLLRDFFEVLGPSGGAKRAKRRAARAGAAGSGGPTAVRSAAVDAVLEKVRTQGLHSLSDIEKGVLRDATDERRGRG